MTWVSFVLMTLSLVWAILLNLLLMFVFFLSPYEPANRILATFAVVGTPAAAITAVVMRRRSVVFWVSVLLMAGLPILATWPVWVINMPAAVLAGASGLLRRRGDPA